VVATIGLGIMIATIIVARQRTPVAEPRR
jgi:hypothetical protein